MDKVCGRHQVNHQNIFEELPYQALVPSDLGLPIVVESQMTYFYSLQGEMSIDCSFNKPSAQVSVTSKASYTYNGYAGTVCPFPQELLVAGINVHRAVNVPRHPTPIMVMLELSVLSPRNSLLLVSM